MAIMAIYQSGDLSPADYAVFRSRLPLTAAPMGALMHAHATDASGFVTVEIWEDQASLNAFLNEVLSPAVKAMGFPFVPPQVLAVDDFVVTEAVRNRQIPYGTLGLL
ncbi:MAG: hypothetical protein U1C74_10215 [Phenylobacterium sp.]|nr:hypothetical protein [Phenylobacterium sp.]